MQNDPLENSYDPREHTASPGAIRATWWIVVGVMVLAVVLPKLI